MSRDVSVGSIVSPQSKLPDFYRELGDVFGIPLSAHNRWGGFKALRQTWSEHVATSLTRPVVIIDEAQEMQSSVLSELRILSSRDFDSEALLCVVFAGDTCLPERLRHELAVIAALDASLQAAVHMLHAIHAPMARVPDRTSPPRPPTPKRS